MTLLRGPQLRIRHQVLLLLVVVTLVTVGISAAIALQQSHDALIGGTYDRLVVARELKATRIQEEVQNTRNEIVALVRFLATLMEVLELDKNRTAVENTRDGLISLLWQRIDSAFRQLRDGLGHEDLIVIRTLEPGDPMVVYSLVGGGEIERPLASSRYAGTNVIACFEAVTDNPGSREARSVAYRDFEPGSLDGQPMACVAAPVFLPDGTLAGAMIERIAIESVNRFMVPSPGLGRTGETYLVGPDFLMRSDSRFERESSVLRRRIDTEATRAALAGETGEGRIANYRGKSVFAAWQPIEVGGVTYALVAEIEAAEALSSIHRTLWIQVAWWLLALCILVLIAYVVAQRIERPLTMLLDRASRMSKHEFGGRIEVPGGGREVQELVESFNDMAEQLDARHVELITARKKAESAAEAKSRFLANMSHEIRTPMNGVIGYTDLALAADPPGAQRDYLRKIQASARVLLGLIKDILDFSKIEAGHLELENIAFGLGQVLSDIDDMFSPQAAERGIGFEIEPPPAQIGALLGDPLRLRQVLMNLVSNAIKFTAQGGVTVRITSCERGEDGLTLRFEVGDTGVGIAPERIESLFDAFTQSDGSTTRRYGGTGLGLAISRELVSMMGGRIGAESEMGKGARFWFEVPFHTAAPGCLDEREQGGVAGTVAPRTLLAGARVLLVEDNLVNREIAQAFLLRVGIEVDTAVNGQEGVEAAVSGDYDAVLMDVQMPVMDGIEATARIRGNNRLSGLPVIAMTAHAMEGDREKLLEAGLDDYVSKPIDPERLYGVLAGWIRSRRTGVEARPGAIGREGDEAHGG